MVCKILWPQVMSIWIKRGHNEENGHSGKKECAQLAVIRLVMGRCINDSPSHISKPQQIRDNKIFTKWNVIVQRDMYHMKMRCDGFFYITKPDQVNGKIQQNVKMLVFLMESGQPGFHPGTIAVQHDIQVLSNKM